MILCNITISNIKSFYDSKTISFDSNFNILIGPNGGGKSNLLDVISIVLRGFLLKGYTITSNQDDRGSFFSIQQVNLNISSILEKYFDKQEDSHINIEFEICKEDIENISLIIANSRRIIASQSQYRNNQIALQQSTLEGCNCYHLSQDKKFNLIF